MSAEHEALDLYWKTQRVGRLFNEQPLRFRYDNGWLEAPAAVSLSPRLPLSQQTHSGNDVLAYFENLLPEGGLRRHIELSHHTTTVFGLLRSVGGDTASGYLLLPGGETPQPACYRPTSWEEINSFLHSGSQTELAEQLIHNARISLAGAQNKLLLMIDENGNPAIPEGAAPSSHLLKPDIKGLHGVWCSALNETLCMQLAAALALDVAETSFQPDTRACLIKRYDRVMNHTTGQLERYHQLDFCQLAGTPSTLKYESDGGPGLLSCRQQLQQVGVPAKDLQRFVRWFFYNLFIGNNDSHAKNLSILHTPEGVRLSPFYDLMCTTIYSGLSKRFAFQVDSVDHPGDIGRLHLESLAKALSFKPAYFLRQGLQLADEVLTSLPDVIGDLSKTAQPGNEQVTLERLFQRITTNCQKMTRRWKIASK
ncbi:type II toxin-antitoxin system HipA family toxin [Vreelandella olivaria]|uniref:type II toxin-antitoxin system HipA family toxin n=1 Tax=Vreelandella olivaria TaxID=390919 RepID=UPI00201EDA7B|nr:type II toxin-antitoxin system HipA family toxin [Halomonas olivaria]